MRQTMSIKELRRTNKESQARRSEEKEREAQSGQSGGQR